MTAAAGEHRFELVANVSLLFGELPMLERFDAAAAAGFHRVEAWWPFARAVPDRAEVDAWVSALEGAGLELTGLNLFAGDMPAGERGLVSRPDRQAEFAANLDVVADIAERTGCRAFNALYGQRVASLEHQDVTAIENLALAVRRLSPLGGTILLEPLSRGLNGAYPIETAAEAIAVLDRLRDVVGADGAALLFDTFHLTNNGEDLVAVIRRYADRIGHVQLADAPGRGEPGSGTVDFAAVLAALADVGYDGLVAAEYKPTTATVETLGWIDGLPELTLG